MAENSKIEWTDHTFNPWIGCQKIAPGCKHCYAEALTKRYGRDFHQRTVTSEGYWKQPLKWNRDAEKAGERRRVFCASLADAFEDWRRPMVDAKGQQLLASPVLTGVNAAWPLTMDHVRERLGGLIRECPYLDWLLLTKRIENASRMMEAMGIAGLPNVWLGTSISTQADADRNIPELLKCRNLCPVLFVSAEPLLEAVDLSRIVLRHDGQPSTALSKQFGDWIDPLSGVFSDSARIDWLIIGGESGPGARPFNPSWAKDLVNQCRYAGVKCFVKQIGSNVIDFSGRLKDPKGGSPEEWPADLRVREFPERAALAPGQARCVPQP